MYNVTHASSGIIAVSFADRGDALHWASENNTLLGEYAMLYIVVKSKPSK
jgi:hypothetical protein